MYSGLVISSSHRFSAAFCVLFARGMVGAGTDGMACRFVGVRSNSESGCTGRMEGGECNGNELGMHHVVIKGNIVLGILRSDEGGSRAVGR